MKPFPKNREPEFTGKPPKGRDRYWQIADMVRAKREAITRTPPSDESGRTPRGATVSTICTAQQGERTGTSPQTG